MVTNTVQFVVLSDGKLFKKNTKWAVLVFIPVVVLPYCIAFLSLADQSDRTCFYKFLSIADMRDFI